MAQTATRRLIIRLRWLFAASAAAIVLFALTAWIGSSIPRNSHWQEPDRGITIMLESNGVHTALVMPLVTQEMDWRAHFPAADIARPRRPYTHISVSWGEKQIFLETEKWSDLSPLTVMRILGVGGEGLLHIAHYVRPAPAGNMRPITLTPAQYIRLTAAIERSVPSGPLVRYDGYGLQDVFYDAPGRYTAINTCNQWTSDMLAEAGVKTGWWTPFPGGVMKWAPQPEGMPKAPSN